jgi:hypothetical protein
MGNLSSYYQNNKAIVCANKNCITVYGTTAIFVNAIAIIAAVLAAIALFNKLTQ